MQKEFPQDKDCTECRRRPTRRIGTLGGSQIQSNNKCTAHQPTQIKSPCTSAFCITHQHDIHQSNPRGVSRWDRLRKLVICYYLPPLRLCCFLVMNKQLIQTSLIASTLLAALRRTSSAASAGTARVPGICVACMASRYLLTLTILTCKLNLFWGYCNAGALCVTNVMTAAAKQK